ncbi:hypothetical protein LMG7974_00093 [Campylobacter majalis]|uniref:Beta-lactamase n=1 Tax=Campylobacter majalis TaxID=2790656 RepID=A0ABN7K2L6_9BACT|nr:hypothetical protein [Campylobacter majalis]CAD7286806.1 hypothetical protein LMG7974_00093 [Campylobacter majalis]
MKKYIIFFVFTLLCAFDIDEFDKGLDAIRAGEYNVAYDIFYKGCEQNDELSCEELGIMYINGEVSTSEDNTVNEKNKNKKGLEFLLKSCKLGYLNACGDIVSLKNSIDEISDELYEYASNMYDELALEFTQNIDENTSKIDIDN